ncbi:MAG: divalent-cation tolerance protein CutA [bacterium]
MHYCLVLSTCSEHEEADHLASRLVENKLASCVQINKIISYYTWKGESKKEPEYRLLIKTKKALYKKVEKYIKKMHSYEVPEIITIPIQDGSKEYLAWIDEVTE